MSQVILLASDRPLPLSPPGERRARTVSYPGGTLTVEEDGFSVGPHEYYRAAVEDLALAMKSFRYELDLRDTPHDLRCLRAYLTAHCVPGEQVELWNLWMGNEPLRVRRFSGRLADFDLETLQQLLEQPQTCMTIEI